MRLWFYVKDSQQHGPVAEDILVQMLAAGTLSSDTLVWTKELKDWTTARDVEGLVPAEVLPPPIGLPPPIPRDSWTPPLATTIYQPSGPQLRPWVRYWARMTDFFLFCFLFGLILTIIHEPLLEINDKLLGILLLFIYIFVEPIMLSSLGTTPGKALLRIRLRRQDGTKLNYSEGLNRAFRVWLRGEGLGIPIVSLFTLITAYRRLTRKGKTSWDRDGHFGVYHQIVGPLRAVVTVLIFIAFFVLIVIVKIEG
jgi:hypothetical protein